MTSRAKKTVSLIFLNILVSVYHAFSAEIWRYSSKEGDGTLFSTQNLIMLEYFGGKGDVDWCYPNECQLKSKSSSSASLHCPKSGLYAVGPITNASNNQGIRYIEVVNDPFYYEWYLAYNRQSKNETREEFRLWIVDPKRVSASEHIRTASAPSKFSRGLTKVFYQLGQKPSLKAKGSYRFIPQDKWIVYNQSFILSEGYWQFVTSRVHHYATTIWIDGQSVALLDCFIRKSSLQLMKTKFNLPQNTDEPQVVVTGGNSSQAPMIFQDPCAPHIAILISSKCFLTQDNFASVEEVKVPAGLLAQSEIVVKSAAFSADNIILLSESGKILVFNGTTQTWGQPSGVSLEKFIGLSSQKKCFEGAEKQVMKGALFAWTNQVELKVVHISRDSGLSFHNISIPAVSGLFNISIQHIEIHCLFSVATFLLHGTNPENQQKGFFLQYNLAEDAWEKHEVSCCLDPPVSFFFNPPSTQFVFVWSEKSFAFGRVNETGSSFKLKRQENQTEFELDANETIVSVTTGGNGDFLVVSSSSRMFYGRAFLGHLVEIHSGEDISSRWTTMFDMLGSLLLIYIEGLGAHQRKLPLKNEVLSAVYPRTSCPYLRFTTSITPELHYMDNGDEIKIWAELIYQRSTPNHIKLEISNSDMLQISTEDSIQHYDGIVTQNTTFTFKYELNGTSNLESPYKSTSLSIQLNPGVAELTCQNNNQALHINVGCPPTKSIVIRSCSAGSDENPLPLLSQIENQDSAVPCQLAAAMDENFKLIVDLYEGGRFVQEVHEDYVVQEETGRIDFGYIATMNEVGCLQEAQRWAKMAINYSGDLKAAWTQSNYRSCFMPDITQNDRSFDGNLPYDILNLTGLSQLLFEGSGWFHFQLRIVATHLSFCELSTRFSVDVTESKGKDYLPQLVSIIVVTLGSALLLYLSYARYTKQTLNRHQENEEEQQRLQELKSLLASLEEGFDNAVQARHRSTVNTVRRFTGTAMLMKNQSPEEFLHLNSGTFERPSNVSTIQEEFTQRCT